MAFYAPFSNQRHNDDDDDDDVKCNDGGISDLTKKACLYRNKITALSRWRIETRKIVIVN